MAIASIFGRVPKFNAQRCILIQRYKEFLYRGNDELLHRSYNIVATLLHRCGSRFLKTFIEYVFL